MLSASGEETEQLLAYGVLDQLARSAGIPGRPPGESGSAPVPLNLEPGRAADQVDDPVTVGARFLEFLDRLDGPGVVLAVDDAHWADRPSLQALIFALRRLAADRVLAIIAVRDDWAPDLPDSLGRLIRKQTGTVLRLRGLDEEDLLELASALGVDGVSAGQPVACATGRGETRCTPGRCWRSSRRRSGVRTRNCCPHRDRSVGWCRTATNRVPSRPAG